MLGPSNLPDADPPADLADTDASFKRACEEVGVEPAIAEAFGWRWEPDSRDLPWTDGQFRAHGYAGLTGIRSDDREWFAPWPPDHEVGIHVKGVKSGVDLLPGAADDVLHVTSCPMAAAVLRAGSFGSVGWFPGRTAWRGAHRKLSPDLQRARNSLVVLHPDKLCWTDVNAFREWETCAKFLREAGLKVKVATDEGELSWAKAFAPGRRPLTEAERRQAKDRAQVYSGGTIAVGAVPLPVQKALQTTLDLFDDRQLRTDLAARAVLYCFDKAMRWHSEGPYVYDERGVWVRGFRDDNTPGIVERVICGLLKDGYKAAHESTILAYLRNLPEGMPRIAVHPAVDKWSNVLNFRNGLLSLDDWELRPHDPSCLSTWQLPVAYEPDAQCPRFQAWLAETLPPDMLVERDGVAPWKEDLGYLLLPGNPFHVAFLLRGGGRNGKGVWMLVAKRMIGDDYVTSLSLEDITDPGRSRFRLVYLGRSAVNLAGEVDPKYVASTARFKEITGGDSIEVEKKFGDSWNMQPWTTLVFSANEDFPSVDRTTAYFDRWKVRDFPNYVPAERRNPHLARDLADAELPGITAAAVAGLRALLARGRFEETASSRAKHEVFRINSDRLRQFAEHRIEFKAGAREQRSTLSEDYKQWSSDEGVHPLSTSRLVTTLVELGREAGVEVAAKKYGGIFYVDGLHLIKVEGGKP